MVVAWLLELEPAALRVVGGALVLLDTGGLHWLIATVLVRRWLGPPPG